MDGENLYGRYQLAMHDQGFGIDNWDDLGVAEQGAWNQLVIDVDLLEQGEEKSDKKAGAE